MTTSPFSGCLVINTSPFVTGAASLWVTVASAPRCFGRDWSTASTSLRATIAYLRGLGVDYLLVHSEELSLDEWTHSRLGLRRRSDSVSAMGHHEDTLVYHLRSAPKNPPEGEAYLPPVVEPGRPYYAYVLFYLPSDQAWVSQGSSPYEVSFEWKTEAGDTEFGTVRGQLPLVLDGGVNVLPVPLSDPPNWPAKLNVEFSGLPQQTEAAQVVTAQREDIEVGLPMADHFWRLSRSFGNDQVLTHAYWRHAMD